MSEIFISKSRAFKLLGITLGVLILMMILSGLVSAGIFWGANISPLMDMSNSSVYDRQILRLALLLNNLIVFLGTGIIVFLIVFGKNWWEAAGLNCSSRPGSTSYSVGFFLLALPLVAWSAWVNLQIPLPDWMIRNEEQTDILLKGVMTFSSPTELILALITVGLTPALGEELLMRGLIQRRILQDWSGNPHLSIIIASALFSAMHLEFAGFMPRMILGILLGYAYYWSNSLWVPIILHLVFNSSQVIMVYITGEFTPDTQMAEAPPWYLAILSFLAIAYIWKVAQNKFGKRLLTTDDTETF